jgi:hypothetical protein
MTKTFNFTSPSNQHIVIDDKYAYRDIVTIDDLKYLFSLKNQLYTTEMFEIAVNNNILDLTTRLDHLDVNMYQIIHIYKSGPEEQGCKVKINQYVTNEELKHMDNPQLETNKVEVKSSTRCIVM